MLVPQLLVQDPTIAGSLFSRHYDELVPLSAVEHLSTQQLSVASAEKAQPLDTVFANRNYINSTNIVKRSFKRDMDSKLEAEKDRLSKIFCPNTDECSRSSDWLTFVPNTTAAWMLGALSLVLAPVNIYIKYTPAQGSYIKTYLGAVSMLNLCICLFLRAALPSPSGNKLIMYRASLISNYVASWEMAMFVVSKLYIIMHSCCDNPNVQFIYSEFFNLKREPRYHGLNKKKYPQYISLALYIAGIYMMFDDEKSKHMAGMQLIKISLLLMLVWMSMLWMQCLMYYRDKLNMLDRQNRLLLYVVSFGMCLWHLFMLARSFAPMNNVTRNSETLLYVLNYAVLFACGSSFKLYWWAYL